MQLRNGYFPCVTVGVQSLDNRIQCSESDRHIGSMCRNTESLPPMTARLRESPSSARIRTLAAACCKEDRRNRNTCIVCVGADFRQQLPCFAIGPMRPIPERALERDSQCGRARRWRHRYCEQERQSAIRLLPYPLYVQDRRGLHRSGVERFYIELHQIDEICASRNISCSGCSRERLDCLSRIRHPLIGEIFHGSVSKTSRIAATMLG